MASETTTTLAYPEGVIPRRRPLKHARLGESVRREGDTRTYHVSPLTAKPIGGSYHCCLIPDDGGKPVWVNWNSPVEMLED